MFKFKFMFKRMLCLFRIADVGYSKSVAEEGVRYNEALQCQFRLDRRRMNTLLFTAFI